MKLANEPESYWTALDTFTTRATVHITRRVSMVAERVWLNTHARGRFSVGVVIARRITEPRVLFHYTVQFEDKQDAMLFKLTFSGLE